MGRGRLVQEHLLHRLGRGRPGQDQPGVEELRRRRRRRRRRKQLPRWVHAHFRTCRCGWQGRGETPASYPGRFDRMISQSLAPIPPRFVAAKVPWTPFPVAIPAVAAAKVSASWTLWKTLNLTRRCFQKPLDLTSFPPVKYLFECSPHQAPKSPAPLCCCCCCCCCWAPVGRIKLYCSYFLVAATSQTRATAAEVWGRRRRAEVRIIFDFHKNKTTFSAFSRSRLSTGWKS